MDVGFWLLAALLFMVCIFIHLYLHHPVIIVNGLQRLTFCISGLTVKQCRSGHHEYTYVERGNRSTSNETLLFIHGFSSNKEEYAMLIKMIPREFHVIALDLPGHGDSTLGEEEPLYTEDFVRRVHEFVKLTGLDRRMLHLIGESMGGTIVGYYGALHPEHVLCVTMICPGMKTPQKAAVTLIKEQTGRVVLIPETPAEFRTMINNAVCRYIPVPSGVARGLIEKKQRNVPYYRRLYDTLSSDDVRHVFNKRVEELKVLTQVIWGVEDKIVHVSGADVLEKTIPSSVLTGVHRLQNCGHAVTLDKPQDAATLIMQLHRQASS